MNTLQIERRSCSEDFYKPIYSKNPKYEPMGLKIILNHKNKFNLSQRNCKRMSKKYIMRTLHFRLQNFPMYQKQHLSTHGYFDKPNDHMHNFIRQLFFSHFLQLQKQAHQVDFPSRVQVFSALEFRSSEHPSLCRYRQKA